MTRGWEYRITAIRPMRGARHELTVADLNDLGRDGWEAVGVLGDYQAILLKRPMPRRGLLGRVRA